MFYPAIRDGKKSNVSRVLGVQRSELNKDHLVVVVVDNQDERCGCRQKENAVVVCVCRLWRGSQG